MKIILKLIELNFCSHSDALHDIHRLFVKDYICDLPINSDSMINSTINNLNITTTVSNLTNETSLDQVEIFCRKDRPILAIFLMLITFWLANKLSTLNQTSLFTRSLRELISDYSLPIAILFFTLISNTVFQVCWPKIY